MSHYDHLKLLNRDKNLGKRYQCNKFLFEP